MNRNEKAIITTLCMVYQNDQLLLQNRVKTDWHGMTFPGGHIEKGESIIQGTKREMWEETGLMVDKLQLCGVKQFQMEGEIRYIVFLFKTKHFEGTLVSSDEGEMSWVKREELPHLNLVPDFMSMLEVMDSEELNEMIYEETNNGQDWILKLY